MKLQTQIPLKIVADSPIDYHSKIALFGSCFVENIGEKLNYYKFQNLQNPFGILFHPLAIEELLTNTANQKVYSDDDVFFKNEQWHCYQAHSKLSATSKTELIDSLNTQVQLLNLYLKTATHVVITLGTAWVYKHKVSHAIVANCHKVLQKEFDKELLSVDRISQSLQNSIAVITQFNPNAKVIFTVSPVRHIKDGFIENSQSKSHLITAIHKVLKVKKSQNSHYFPSYEIMLDELRDYRFYKADMLHPNEVAVSYIWEKFTSVWLAKETLKTLETVENIQKGLLHRPFNSNSEAHQKFLKNLKEKQKKLQLQFPSIIF
ncbi:GSCFA domain-containing protein [Lacinutrix undariae]